RWPTSTVAGPTRSTRLRAGGRRFGRWSRCGRRSAWRWYGSDWCWAATCPPPHGSRRASASERRAVTAIGVGVDLVEVSRVAAIIADKGSRVFERLLTPTERAYCESRPDPATHVAVRLAAKEAVYKALQGSEAARGIGWREIEVIRAPDGRPDVRLTGFAAARAGPSEGFVVGGPADRGGGLARREGVRDRGRPARRSSDRARGGLGGETVPGAGAPGRGVVAQRRPGRGRLGPLPPGGDDRSR